MNKKKKAKLILAITLLALIIIVAIIMLNTIGEENSDDIRDIINNSEINYYNEETSYYDYYDKGKISIDITEFVELPENYLDYTITANTEEEIEEKLDEIFYLIITASEVRIPNEVLTGYYGDIYTNIKKSAENNEQSVDKYVNSLYENKNYLEFAESNEETYKNDIKNDLVYQALSQDLNINVNQSDIEEYYSKRIKEEGYTFEELKSMYGEDLLYKSTLQNKVKQELLKRFVKQ